MRDNINLILKQKNKINFYNEIFFFILELPKYLYINSFPYVQHYFQELYFEKHEYRWLKRKLEILGIKDKREKTSNIWHSYFLRKTKVSFIHTYHCTNA